jgi:hypothetical protein
MHGHVPLEALDLVLQRVPQLHAVLVQTQHVRRQLLRLDLVGSPPLNDKKNQIKNHQNKPDKQFTHITVLSPFSIGLP